MKTILISVATLLVSITSAFAGENLQYIDCSFAEPGMHDRVIVNIYSDFKTGTLFYTTGISDDGDARTPALKMSRIADIASQKDLAQFSATFNGNINGEPVSMDFQFAMPKSMIFQTSNYFQAEITTTTGYQGPLSCFSRIYPKN